MVPPEVIKNIFYPKLLIGQETREDQSPTLRRMRLKKKVQTHEVVKRKLVIKLKSPNLN